MFERYTEASRRAIFFAREEAKKRGAAEISTSDIFLGIIREPAEENSALAPLHARQTDFRELFNVSPDPQRQPELNPPLSAFSKRALACAAQDAERRQLWPITRDILLRELLTNHDETVTKLNADGVTLKTLMSCAPSERASGPPMTRRRAYHGLRKLLRNNLLIVVAILFAATILYLHSQN